MIDQNWTFVAVDQFNKPVKTVLRRGWHEIGSRPTTEVVPSRKGVTVLGALSHEGESFYCWTDEYLTADHGERLLGALESEFGEKLVVMLDRARYFYAKDGWEAVSDERSTEFIDETSVERVRNNELEVCYFPPKLPELNPVEHCWNQLDAWFNYRLIEDLDHLEAILPVRLEAITEPNLVKFLLPESDEPTV